MRRRYTCSCGERWTTAEFRVDEVTRSRTKIAAFRQDMAKDALRSALVSLLAGIK